MLPTVSRRSIVVRNKELWRVVRHFGHRRPVSMYRAFLGRFHNVLEGFMLLYSGIKGD